MDGQMPERKQSELKMIGTRYLDILVVTIYEIKQNTKPWPTSLEVTQTESRKMYLKPTKKWTKPQLMKDPGL